MIASPSFGSSTPSWNSACVPIANGVSPLASAASALLRAFAGTEPDSHAIGTPRPSSHAASLR